MNRFAQQSVVLSVVLTASVWWCGCAKPQRTYARLPTFPVTGVVTVDGQPAQFVAVECHPEADAGIKTSLTCTTDADGNFSLGAYEAGGGLPSGKYRLTFTWLVPGGLSPKDKLNGNYADVTKSQHKVTVESKPSDLGTIALSS